MKLLFLLLLSSALWTNQLDSLETTTTGQVTKSPRMLLDEFLRKLFHIEDILKPAFDQSEMKDNATSVVIDDEALENLPPGFDFHQRCQIDVLEYYEVLTDCKAENASFPKDLLEVKSYQTIYLHYKIFCATKNITCVTDEIQLANNDLPEDFHIYTKNNTKVLLKQINRFRVCRYTLDGSKIIFESIVSSEFHYNTTPPTTVRPPRPSFLETYIITIIIIVILVVSFTGLGVKLCLMNRKVKRAQKLAEQQRQEMELRIRRAQPQKP